MNIILTPSIGAQAEKYLRFQAKANLLLMFCFCISRIPIIPHSYASYTVGDFKSMMFSQAHFITKTS